ncbi:MAG: hypothetical protein JST92_26845 [Deltaproteobacteria bacterium]|nr:hypothetical protein [Deltaproteobacteria bacterium]
MATLVLKRDRQKRVELLIEPKRPSKGSAQWKASIVVSQATAGSRDTKDRIQFMLPGTWTSLVRAKREARTSATDFVSGLLGRLGRVKPGVPKPLSTINSRYRGFTRNPMLVSLVHNAIVGGNAAPNDDGPYTPHSAVLWTAVHAWYEGHLAAEIDRKLEVPLEDSAAHFPSPPFPDRDDKRLAAIIQDSKERLGWNKQLTAPMIAYAASLAWAEGYKEGQQCRGCSVRGDAMADAIRRGEYPVTLGPVSSTIVR